MAPRTLTHTHSSALNLPPNSYIYKIISTAPRQNPLTFQPTDQLAIISSDDSLRFLDPATLNLQPADIITNVNHSVTCLERVNDPASNIVATAGRDGFVRFWDKRSAQRAMIVQSPNPLISSLVCDSERNLIAAGIENPDDGPSSSPIYIWDQRNVAKPLLEFVESHTDTITDLQLHAALPTLLLSASTDGLISIFDLSKPDEEEALYQVANHRSAVARAGFMYPNTDIYAMGTDETLSFYALQSPAEDKEEPAPKVLGDVREGLGCEYLAKMHWVGEDAYVAAGKHSTGSLELFPVHKVEGRLLDYTYNPEKKICLPGAHGEEIVRDLFTDVHSNTTFTCAEDGSVRAWKMEGEEETMDVDDTAEPEHSEKSKNKKARRKENKDKRKGGDEGKKSRFNPY